MTLGVLDFVPVRVDPRFSLGQAMAFRLIAGGLFGFVMSGVVEGVIRFVNFVDKVLETKSDGETRRD